MMRRILLFLLACLPLWTQPAAPPRKIQVLIITGRDDHDWRGATPLMRDYPGHSAKATQSAGFRATFTRGVE
jgi:hypothetical protein